MKVKIFKLRFTGPVHFGDERDDYSVSLRTIHSDSLYAAITSALATLGFNIPPDGDLGFQISSLFPYYQKDEQSQSVLFFPRVSVNYKIDVRQFELYKKIKKCQWFDLKHFEKIIKGEDFEINPSALKGEFYTDEDIDKDFIVDEVVPRVVVSRVPGEDARPFYMDRIYFKGHSGLFFLATGENLNLIEKALTFLQTEGLGTDKTVGNGQFEYQSNENDYIDINLPESNYVTNLSLFIPESYEQLRNMLKISGNTVSETRVAYNFIRRGGWITTPPYNTFRKNYIYAFTEGSVFVNNEPLNNYVIRGKTVNLKPQNLNLPHPIFRNGKAIFLPVVLKN